MQDKLEEYIRSQRAHLDDKDPPKAIWEKLEKELPVTSPAKTIRLRPLIIFVSGMAASLLLAFVGIVGYKAFSGTQDGQTLANAPAYQEYEQLEKIYIKEVNAKMEEMGPIKIDKTIEEDLNQLDAIYQELKAELIGSNMNSHEIIEALINTYKTKIELLEIISKKQAKSKKDDTETINI